MANIVLICTNHSQSSHSPPSLFPLSFLTPPPLLKYPSYYAYCAAAAAKYFIVCVFVCMVNMMYINYTHCMQDNMHPIQCNITCIDIAGCAVVYCVADKPTQPARIPFPHYHQMVVLLYSSFSFLFDYSEWSVCLIDVLMMTVVVDVVACCG